MRWVRHLAALDDFVGLVVLHAPDRFRREDFLADCEKLNLDRAFGELRNGLEFVTGGASDSTIGGKTHSARRQLHGVCLSETMMRFVRSLASLYDFIATVVLGAPDRFRVRDHRAPADQLSLDRAFEELRTALEFVLFDASDPGLHDRLRQVLDESLAAYRVGEPKKGAHRLQDFQDMIFVSKDERS